MEPRVEGAPWQPVWLVLTRYLTRIGWTTLIYSGQRTPPGSHVILPMWMTAFGVIAVAVAASVLALLLEIRHRRTHAVPGSGG